MDDRSHKNSHETVSIPMINYDTIMILACFIRDRRSLLAFLDKTSAIKIEKVFRIIYPLKFLVIICHFTSLMGKQSVKVCKSHEHTCVKCGASKATSAQAMVCSKCFKSRNLSWNKCTVCGTSCQSPPNGHLCSKCASSSSGKCVFCGASN